jgi:alginate O-acetyltransferase complex protein AlgF
VKSSFACLLSMIACVSAAPAFAADDALYDPVPPPDSAYVRIIDATCQGKLEASVGGRPVLVPEGGVSAYVVMTKGKVPVTISGRPGTSADVEGGKYYTVVVNTPGGAGKTLEDPADANPDKSRVYLYNLSGTGGASLFAPKLNVAIIDNVENGAVGSRAINAVTVDVAVRVGEKVIETFAQRSFRRRSGDTFVLCASGAASKVIAARNETAR